MTLAWSWAARSTVQEVCYSVVAHMNQEDRQAPIALFLPTMDDGGAEHVMLRLGAAFVARGHSVDLVVAIPGGPIESKIPATLRVVDLAARRTTAALPALVRYLRRERPAALLSSMPEYCDSVVIFAAVRHAVDAVAPLLLSFPVAVFTYHGFDCSTGGIISPG